MIRFRANLLFLAAAVLFAGGAIAAPSKGKGAAPGKLPLPNEFQSRTADQKITTANWGPKRLKPVFTGAFQVDLVCTTFPDCTTPDPKAVMNDLDHIQGGAYTIKDYYDDYSQNTTYPVLAVYPTVYVAPNPFGYYCRWDRWGNKIGWNNDG